MTAIGITLALASVAAFSTDPGHSQTLGLVALFGGIVLGIASVVCLSLGAAS